MTNLADLEVEREIYRGILSLNRVTPSMAFVLFTLNNGAEGETGARNYRPRFRENKPKTLVFND